MKHLAAFLESGCGYTKGAERTGMSLGRFRNRVLEELAVLQNQSGCSFYPFRAAHLRQQAPQIKLLLTAFRTDGCV